MDPTQGEEGLSLAAIQRFTQLILSFHSSSIPFSISAPLQGSRGMKAISAEADLGVCGSGRSPQDFLRGHPGCRGLAGSCQRGSRSSPLMASARVARPSAIRPDPIEPPGMARRLANALLAVAGASSRGWVSHKIPCQEFASPPTLSSMSTSIRSRRPGRLPSAGGSSSSPLENWPHRLALVWR